MKLEEYQAGKYVNMKDYKAFIPSKINYNWEWNDTKLNKLLSEADRQIGELNAYSLLIPNVDLYIKMHVKIEANKSSRIEGTRTTIDEDLLDITDINPEKRDDWQEVQNYVKAINHGIERIKNDMIGWIKFFLEAIIETSKTAKEKFKKVVEFTQQMNQEIMTMSIKSENAKKVLEVLYNEPAINRKKLCKLTGITESTIKNIVNKFVERDVIIETTGYSRNQIFKFQKYTDLFLE